MYNFPCGEYFSEKNFARIFRIDVEEPQKSQKLEPGKFLATSVFF